MKTHLVGVIWDGAYEVIFMHDPVGSRPIGGPPYVEHECLLQPSDVAPF